MPQICRNSFLNPPKKPKVDDMDKAVTYLAGKGVAITWGPVTLEKSKRAEIKDSDGLPIELRQW